MDRLEYSSRASTLVELLRNRAVHQSDRTAYTFLVDGETQALSLTYQELDRLSRAIAAVLQSADLAGKRAVLLYPPGLEYIAAFFGCLYAGVIAVPAYPPRPNRSVARIQSMLADARVTIALTTSNVLSTLEKQFDLAPELKDLKWLVSDRLDLAAADNWSEPDISSHTLAFLQYTSGSTATPKGVAITHQNLLHNSEGIYRAFEHSPDSSVVSWLPMYHDMGLIGGVLQPLYGGFPATLMSPLMFLQRPLRWLQAISRYRATSSGGPNFAYDLCARKIAPEQCEDLDLSCWDVAFNGAEPISQKVLEQFAAAFAPCGFRREAFYPCYGLAEATLFVSGGSKNEFPTVETIDANALAQHRVARVEAGAKNARGVVSCGKSLADQEIAIVDPHTLQPCQPGQIGEIWVSGPSVALGYWQQPEITERTFRARALEIYPVNGRSNGHGNGNGHHNGRYNGHGHSPPHHPFLRTGDLGFIKNGELFVTGRLK
ncbi:MAG: fatty acyl-AMP ligase, partial [Cyanobacteriota bacterium]|nr:fatty acyl-AMP ligase [Cyanobacteriota bacterium]